MCEFIFGPTGLNCIWIRCMNVEKWKRYDLFILIVVYSVRLAVGLSKDDITPRSVAHTGVCVCVCLYVCVCMYVCVKLTCRCLETSDIPENCRFLSNREPAQFVGHFLLHPFVQFGPFQNNWIGLNYSIVIKMNYSVHEVQITDPGTTNIRQAQHFFKIKFLIGATCFDRC
jgi:hypothetical protein